MTKPLSYYCGNPADKPQIEKIEQIAGACLQALDPQSRIRLLIDTAIDTELYWRDRNSSPIIYAQLETLAAQLTEKGKLELLTALTASLTTYAASLPADDQSETVDISGISMEVGGQAGRLTADKTPSIVLLKIESTELHWLRVETGAASEMAFEVSTEGKGFNQVLQDICSITPALHRVDFDLMEAADGDIRIQPKESDLELIRLFIARNRLRNVDCGTFFEVGYREVEA